MFSFMFLLSCNIHGGFTGGALKSCYFSHVKKVEGQAAFRLVISFVSERQTQRVTADKMVAYQIKLAEKTAEKVRYGFWTTISNNWEQKLDGPEPKPRQP